MSDNVRKYPYDRLRRLREVPPPGAKYNETAVDVLEKALRYCREGYVTAVMVGVLEPGDRLTVWRDENLPVYETLGFIEYIRKHVDEDIGVLDDLTGPKDGAA